MNEADIVDLEDVELVEVFALCRYFFLFLPAIIFHAKRLISRSSNFQVTKSLLAWHKDICS